jgi:hypothetical protein
LECLTAIIGRGLDWRRFSAAAYANLVVPLVAKHVLPLIQSEQAREFREILTDARNRTVMRMMHVCALKQNAVSLVLNQRRIPFFELKGSVLSTELYGDPFIRQYRDIDLLVDPRRLEEAAQGLMRLDWRVMNKEWNPAAGRDLSVLSQYQAAIELYSPTGVVLELHRTLDNSGCVFSSRDIFSKTKNQVATGKLPNDVHFAYMCFHHSRHKWSSLHWFADAQALFAMPQATIDATRRIAERLGLLKTVDETLRLVRNLDELALAGRTSGLGLSLFFDDCIRALRENSPDEAPPASDASIVEDRHPDFAYKWQKTSMYQMKFAMSRFRPSLNDYEWMPLRANLRWIYWLSKPCRVFLETVTGRKTT